jgi:hypothetical protein
MSPLSVDGHPSDAEDCPGNHLGIHGRGATTTGALVQNMPMKSRNDYRNMPLLTARVLARIGFGHWRVQLRLGQPRPVGRWPYGRAGELFSGHF